MSPLFPVPAADFDHPLAMLAACHERIADQCATLLRLVEYVSEHGADDQARQAARNVMRYFDVAGPHHHADEESELFPGLLAAAGARASGVGDLVQRLCADHRVLEGQWAALRAVLHPLSSGESVVLPQTLVDGFVTHYRQHLALEDAQLLPLATALLPAATLAGIGAAMAERRGVRPQGTQSA